MESPADTTGEGVEGSFVAPPTKVGGLKPCEDVVVGSPLEEEEEEEEEEAAAAAEAEAEAPASASA